MVRSIDGNGDVTTNSYDPLQRQVATTDPMSGTTVMTYSATELVAVQDPQGNVTRSVYDGAGRLLQQTDPISGTTQYAYDPVGNTTVISAGTSGAVMQVDRRQYDAQDHVVTETVGAPAAPGTQTLTAYDADGNVSAVQQPNGDSTRYFYDGVDQRSETFVLPAGVNQPPTTDEQDYYDHAGNQTSTVDFDGREHQTSYNGADRALLSTDTYTSTPSLLTSAGFDPDGNTITRTVTQSGQAQAQTFSFNAADWQTSETDNGLRTDVGYDAAGQERGHTLLGASTVVTTTLRADGAPSAITEGTGSAGPYTTTFQYNADTLPVTVTLPNGVTQSGQYDANSRLTGVQATGPGGPGGLANSYSYGYDALGETTAVTSSDSLGITATTYTHDALGRLTQWSGQPNGPESWGYDGNDNIISNTEFISGAMRQTVYTYSASIPNQEMQQHTDGLGVESYQYDHSGNTTSLTSTDFLSDPTSPYAVNTFLSYDSQGRPTQITLNDRGTPVTVTLGYNAQGFRSRYTVERNGVTSYDARYQYHDDQVTQATIISGTQSYTDTYVYAPNGTPLELLRQYQGQPVQRYWYVLDGRKNVVTLTDVNGTVVDRYAYDPWGEGLPQGTMETVDQPFRYGSYWWGAALGWYWVNVRSLDPEGRWLQPDPSQQDGVRTYAYLADDPVDGADPSGQQGPYPCEDVFGTVGGAQPACEGGGGPHDGPPLSGGNGNCGAAPFSMQATPACGSGGDVDTTPPPNDNDRDRAASRAEPEVPWLRERYDRLPASLQDQIQQFKGKWYKSNLPTQQDTLTYHWYKWARPRGINPEDYTTRAMTFYRMSRNARGASVNREYSLGDRTFGIKITYQGRVGIYKEVDGTINIVDYFPENGGNIGPQSRDVDLWR